MTYLRLIWSCIIQHLELPPHLSPFVKEGQYVPPDMEILQSKARGEDPGIGKDSDEEVDEESDDDAEDLEDDDEETEETAEPPAKKMAKVVISRILKIYD